MQMQRVSPGDIRYAGPMRSAAVFRAGPKQVEVLDLQDFEDDLDHYLAAYFLYRDVPLAVQRHDGNEPGTYTIIIDALAASQHHVKLSDVRAQVLYGLLDLPERAVVWTAPDNAYEP